LVHNEGVAHVFIDSVRRLGCGVALDDFGTGYGSFRYLKNLPVNVLKLDQEFVRDLEGETSTVNRHVIQATVTLAQGMGQKTVAEGVETESTLDLIRDLGVDYAQGYLFARPGPANQLLA
jgi:EAL domain-containing protein (putative c-di-GMP-specific phosphodiesterase class I)